MSRIFLCLIALAAILASPLPDAHARRIVVKTKVVAVAAVAHPVAVIKTKTVIKGR